MKPTWAHPCSAKAYIRTQFLRVMEYVGSKAVCWYRCDTGDVTSIGRKLTKPSSRICLLPFLQGAMNNPTTHPPHHSCTPPLHQPTPPPHRGGGGHPSHGVGGGATKYRIIYIYIYISSPYTYNLHQPRSPTAALGAGLPEWAKDRPRTGPGTPGQPWAQGHCGRPGLMQLRV